MTSITSVPPGVEAVARPIGALRASTHERTWTDRAFFGPATPTAVGAPGAFRAADRDRGAVLLESDGLRMGERAGGDAELEGAAVRRARRGQRDHGGQAARWRYDFGGDAGVVESYVSYLRRKVDTTEPKLLHTLRGVGCVPREPQVSRR